MNENGARATDHLLILREILKGLDYMSRTYGYGACRLPDMRSFR